MSETVQQAPLLVGNLSQPKNLQRLLSSMGVFNFTPYDSGLYPACDFSAEQQEATGMGMAWLRDNAHIANALFEADRHKEARAVGRSMLQILNDNIDDVTTGDSELRLPVRVNGDTLKRDNEPRRQNDSTGYALWFIGKLFNEEVMNPSKRDLECLERTAQHLGKIAFWNDLDEGHWEEDRRVHASSIGAVVAGLQEVGNLLENTGYRHDIQFDSLIENGAEALHKIIDSNLSDKHPDAYNHIPAPALPSNIHTTPETKAFFESFHPTIRHHDAALLFLVEPLQVINGERARRIVANIEQNLVREYGTIRYPGDTYWGPRFKDIMSQEERTTMAEGRTDQRNLTAAGNAYSRTEAQWTLFDSTLSAYWGRQYQYTRSPQCKEKQLTYLDRALRQLVYREEEKRFTMPEAFFYDHVEGKNIWIPNDHSDLLWARANLMRAVQAFEETN